MLCLGRVEIKFCSHIPQSILHMENRVCRCHYNIIVMWRYFLTSGRRRALYIAFADLPRCLTLLSPSRYLRQYTLFNFLQKQQQQQNKKKKKKTRIDIKVSFYNKAVEVIWSIYNTPIHDTFLPVFPWPRPKSSTLYTLQARWRSLCHIFPQSIFLVPGSGDDGGVISHPTAANICSIYRVFHEVKHRRNLSRY